MRSPHGKHWGRYHHALLEGPAFGAAAEGCLVCPLPIQVLDAPFLIQFLANASWMAADDSSNTWASATHMGNLDRVLGSGLGLAQP